MENILISGLTQFALTVKEDLLSELIVMDDYDSGFRYGVLAALDELMDGFVGRDVWKKAKQNHVAGTDAKSDI